MSHALSHPSRLVPILILIGSAALARGAEPVDVATRDAIRAVIEKEYPSLDSLYTDIHRNPELSLQEEKTAARLAKELRAAGFEVTEKVGGTGVVAVMKNGDGKTLLIRADMDALPVKEETGAEYASEATQKDPSGQVVPVMHACGHDIHVASLVGTARTMAALKDRWKGTLVLIGQPAEEIGRGARMMLDDGLFTRFPRPDWCLALHVDPELTAGKAGFVPGYAMANVDSVDIVVRGIAGHGAQPQQTKDPIVISAQIIMALQTIASREVHPREPVVVTVGSIHGGTKHNVIPPLVTMQLTVRTYTDEVRAQVLAAIERIAKGTAAAAGVPERLLPLVSVKKDEYTPACYNTPELVERITAVHRRVLGADNVVERDPTMGGEDFGRYGREEPKIPIFMFRVGSVAPERMEEHGRTGKPLSGLHSGLYLPERKGTIQTGVLAMTASALDLLAK